MEKGKIRRIQNIPEELKKVENSFITSTEENTEKHISDYLNLESSHNGSYVCSDLFKETFYEYAKSLDTRKKYGLIVHNSAAVLSNELFHRVVKSGKMKKCIFLSGVPGAGKSFLIQSLYLSNDIDDDTIVFEGDVSSPSILEKVDFAKKNGLDIYIIIVNPTVELALKNVSVRRSEIGRGASYEIMARIMSKLPSALKHIKELYPDIELGIYSKESNEDINLSYGFENVDSLNHGSYEEILEQLKYLEEVMINDSNKVSEVAHAR